MLEIPEVLRDHLEECMKHLRGWFNSKVPKGKSGRRQVMAPLGNFCGVGTKTTSIWLDDDLEVAPPRGEILLKLLCYLDLHGYKVIEFERMPPPLRKFAELIGYGVISIDAAPGLVGYRTVSQVYQVIHEREGASSEKEEKMYAVWKDKREVLEQKKLQAFKSGRLEVLFKQKKKSEPPQQAPLLLTSAPDTSPLRSVAFDLIKGLLTLLDQGVLRDLSESEVATLEQADMVHIAQLSVHLSTLSAKFVRIEKG